MIYANLSTSIFDDVDLKQNYCFFHDQAIFLENNYRLSHNKPIIGHFTIFFFFNRE